MTSRICHRFQRWLSFDNYKILGLTPPPSLVFMARSAGLCAKLTANYGSSMPWACPFLMRGQPVPAPHRDPAKVLPAQPLACFFSDLQAPLRSTL